MDGQDDTHLKKHNAHANKQRKRDTQKDDAQLAAHALLVTHAGKHTISNTQGQGDHHVAQELGRRMGEHEGRGRFLETREREREIKRERSRERSREVRREKGRGSDVGRDGMMAGGSLGKRRGEEGILAEKARLEERFARFQEESREADQAQGQR